MLDGFLGDARGSAESVEERLEAAGTSSLSPRGSQSETDWITGDSE
jgi:hypothetical protein